MKTFETEKHNIPEGATHYIDQSELTYFAWGKFDGEKLSLMLTNENQWTRVSGGLFFGLQPIPQTKEVEWVNGLPPVGVECEVLLDCSGKWKLCEILFSSKESVVVVKLKSGSEIALDPYASSFRKPETPEQKLEREFKNSTEELLRGKVKFNNDLLPGTIARILFNAGYRKG